MNTRLVTFEEIIERPKDFRHLRGWCHVSYTAQGFGHPEEGTPRAGIIWVRQINSRGIHFDHPVGANGVRSRGQFLLEKPTDESGQYGGQPSFSNLRIRPATAIEARWLSIR